LATRLQNAGHRIVDAPEAAHVVIFNSCAVTSGAVKDSRKRVNALHRVNQAARIAVTGCWATLEPAVAAAQPGVALVAGNSQKELLATLLEPWSAEFTDPASLAHMQPDGNPFAQWDAHAEEYSAVESRVARTRTFVKVQDGCNNRCTFCIVTALRGDSRSRPLADVVAEVRQAVLTGVQEIVLTGVHLGAWGRDLPGNAAVTLYELVAALLEQTAIARIRLSSLEPWELAPGFFELWQRWPGRLCPHLHLPLQAGTDAQLRTMARRCTTASFRQLVAAARCAIPHLMITTDLIAGFPGESDADFEEGLRFVKEMRFAHAHLFPFSARSGTAAARFGGQVAAPVKKERLQQLQRVVAETGRQERLEQLGRVRPVLWEGEGRRLTDEPGALLWSGLTDNYLRVLASAPAGLDLHNKMTPVQLDTLEGDIIHGTLLADGLGSEVIRGAAADRIPPAPMPAREGRR
jgi:threonylcarbamoyladenosine tRNA methylthiotransferase MtaB